MCTVSILQQQQQQQQQQPNNNKNNNTLINFKFKLKVIIPQFY